MTSKKLRPFFPYYGSKWSIIKHYPAPKHSIIIEPFAGSASYALHYPDRQVRLYDKDETVVALWNYIIGVSESEIATLADFVPGEDLRDRKLTQEQSWLLGFWANPASAAPKHKVGSFTGWNAAKRERTIAQLQYVRHWKADVLSYDEIDNDTATWFVDPPYVGTGKYYRHSSRSIDYGRLGGWCAGRGGQVIACENEGADWLPFRAVAAMRSSRSYTDGRRSLEAVWTSDDEGETP